LRVFIVNIDKIMIHIFFLNPKIFGEILMIENDNKKNVILKQQYLKNYNITENDFDFLINSMPDLYDERRLKRYLRRRELGEPLEYILGSLIFRNEKYYVDKRVYITDKELTHLVDEIVKLVSGMNINHRAPVIVECGVGCGALSISVKKELPQARLIGLDLDSDAISVAYKNIRNHHLDIMLVESDIFSDYPNEIVPDLIFADPPWGDEASIYDDQRDANYYHAMPCLSAFPVGGMVAMHEKILKEIKKMGWTSDILMNMGVIESKHIKSLCDLTSWFEVKQVNEVSILHCKMNQAMRNKGRIPKKSDIH